MDFIPYPVGSVTATKVSAHWELRADPISLYPMGVVTWTNAIEAVT